MIGTLEDYSKSTTIIHSLQVELKLIISIYLDAMAENITDTSGTDRNL